MTQETKNRIIYLFRNNKSVKEIMEDTHYSKTPIYRVINEEMRLHSCEDCKYCMRLYDLASADVEVYVCTLFIGEDKIVYLGDNTGRCEMHTRRKRK